MKRLLFILISAALVVAMVISCKKDKEIPHYPTELKEITLDQTAVEIFIGEEVVLNISYSPDNATYKREAIWLSSDNTVASVYRGVVKGLAAGEAVITAKAGTKTATCKITIVPIPEPEVEFHAELVAKSSSTLAFTWDRSFTNAFTVSLYSDSDCAVTVAEFNIPAGDACWMEAQPKFIIGGLNPGTDYWFRAFDTTRGLQSELVQAKTDDFEIVSLPESVTEPGVILAEDFGELRWHSDLVSGAAGFVPNETSSLASYDVKNFVNGTVTTGEIRFGTISTALESSRLKEWIMGEKTYVHCGYIKMGTSSSAATAVVTPAIPVPEGKKASVNVTVTVKKFNEDQENEWTVSANANPSRCLTFNFNGADEWETHTVEGLEIISGDRIVFAPKENCASNMGRALINDIKVEVTGIEDIIIPVASINVNVLEITSSTVSVTWNEGNSENIDNEKAYTATIYSDEDCTIPVQSHSFAAGQGTTLWRSGKYPKFIFAGLAPNTQYYVKVTDAEDKFSDPVSAKTSEFTHVQMPASISSTGVVLAEDFGELTWDFEYGQGCVGINKNGTGYNKFEEGVGAYGLFSDYSVSNTRLKYWARDTGSDDQVRLHPGYVTIGSFTKNKKGWILTPEFSIQEGKVATVKITLTARRGATSAEGALAVGILNNSSNSGADGGGAGMIDTNTSNFNWPNDRPDTIYNQFSPSSDEVWATFVFEGMKIHAHDRIIIGGKAPQSSDINYIFCLNLSDITVEVTAVENE